MRKLFTLFLLLSAAVSQAATWIVSNVPGFPGNYTDLQSCINAAANGDIILVQGSGTGYGPIEINKQLIIMGPGYFLNQNPETQAIATSAKVEYISCTTGATGSIIQGLEVTGYMSNVTGESFPCPWPAGPVGYAAINIDGCAVTLISVKVDPLGQWIHLRNSTGTTIQKCYGSGVFCSNNVGGLTIENCIMNYGAYANNATIRNCFLDLDLSSNDSYALPDCNVTNTILGQPSQMHVTGTTFTNNIFLNVNPLGLNAGNNITGEEAQNLFVGVPNQGTYSNDGKFKLRTGCSAIGSGVGNVDIGPFGGANPYALSGISFHPNIWSVTMPTTGTSGGGLPVQVKVNANN